jgi:hypothetical protein
MAAAKLTPTQFNFPGMMQMGGGGGAPNPNANGDMGMKLLQAALAQQKQGQTPQAPQPQAGQIMPGGAMNITPPQQGGIMGAMSQGGPMSMGLLSKLFGPGGTFGQPVPPAAGQPGMMPGDAAGSAGGIY